MLSLRFAASLLLAGSAAAQTPLAGDVYDGLNGPLLSGQVYFTTADLSVPSGEVLTVEEGAILKFANGTSIEVLGDLAAPAGADQAVFTSILDDSIGGDTGLDGATTGVAGAWGGLRSLPGATVVLENSVVTFGGGVAPVINGEGGAIELYDCVVSDNAGAGIDGLGLDTTLIVERCALDNNTGYPVFNVLLEQLGDFQDNTAAGNGLGNAIQLADADVLRDVSLDPTNLTESTILTRGSLIVSTGVTVELGAGVVVKAPPFAVGLWTVDGTLRVTGTDLEPVVFTSLSDDSAGGDSNNDGPSSGAPGDWGGIAVPTGGTLEAQFMDVRFGGIFGVRALRALGGSIDVEQCRFHDNEGPGIDLDSRMDPVRIVGCDLDDNTGVAIDNAAVAVLPGLDGNLASGNAQGDAVRGSMAPVEADVDLLARNVINGVLVLPGSLDLLVQNSVRLTLGAGIIFKWEQPGALDIFGELIVNGTASRPVVMTSIDDDEFGGDSAGDGPTVGAPGATRGVRLRVQAIGEIEHLRSRFAGAVQAAAVLVESPNVRLRSVRADQSDFSGIRMFDLGFDAVNLIADNCAAQGILLEGGAGDVLHATSVNNSIGIGRNVNYLGVVRNSIAWGNSIADVDMFADATEITDSLASDAPAGGGNLTADPLLIDALAGDLRLDPLSPAIDAGDIAVGIAVASDFEENPRLLSRGSGTSRPDMGALEDARWRMNSSGIPALGQAIDFMVSGDPGVGLYAYGAVGTPTLINPFGLLLIGPGSLKALQFVNVGSPYTLTIPDLPILIGREVGIESFVIDALDPTLAQFSNVERLAIEPALP